MEPTIPVNQLAFKVEGDSTYVLFDLAVKLILTILGLFQVLNHEMLGFSTLFQAIAHVFDILGAVPTEKLEFTMHLVTANNHVFFEN